MRLMQQNLEHPKTVEELSRELGVGRRTLERRFLADLGQTPLKVYLDLRLERALQRLRGSEASITEVALACGFCDGPHLSRTLKAERGVTPAEYRKAQAGQGRAEDQPPVGVLMRGAE